MQEAFEIAVRGRAVKIPAKAGNGHIEVQPLRFINTDAWSHHIGEICAVKAGERICVRVNIADLKKALDFA